MWRSEALVSAPIQGSFKLARGTAEYSVLYLASTERNAHVLALQFSPYSGKPSITLFPALRCRDSADIPAEERVF